MSKKMLELFCGTKSVGNVFEKYDHEIISLDYNKKFNATFTENILTWNYNQYPPDYFDIIWASPDCTSWSVASGGKHRTKKNIDGYTETANIGNQMIFRVMEIIDYFKPKSWFIENPRGLLQHYLPFKNWIEHNNANKGLVYYGNYNWGFPKPTNIWSNLQLWQEKKPIMDKSLCSIRYSKGKIKYDYKQYSSAGAEERSKIPPDLIERLYELYFNTI